jgi:hypothetical protein
MFSERKAIAPGEMMPESAPNQLFPRFSEETAVRFVHEGEGAVG